MTSTASADSGKSGNPRPFMPTPCRARNGKDRSKCGSIHRKHRVVIADFGDETSRSDAQKMDYIIARRQGLDKFHANFRPEP